MNIESERAAFEAWYETTYGISLEPEFRANHFIGYVNDKANHRWTAWQARAVLSAPSHGEQVRVLGHDGWRQAVDNVSAYAHLYNSGFGIIHEIRAEYARLIAAAPSANHGEQVLDGWQLVPVEMTQEMYLTFCEERGKHGATFRSAYKAMLADAPTPAPTVEPAKPEPIQVEAVAVTREDEDGELYLDWLIEGGISALEVAGQTLLIAHGQITDDEGGGEVYTVEPAHIDVSVPRELADCEDWSVFFGYLIDKYEGHEIAEERLQGWLAEMLADPHYGALFRREKANEGLPSPISLAIEAAEEEHGSLRAAAKALGIDAGYLSRLKNGEKLNPGDDVLAALGLERVTMYRAAAPSAGSQKEQGE